MFEFPDIDIYCQIIDNYGDIGFCKTFAKTYQERHPNAKVRLFVDGSPAAPEKSAPLVVETFGCDIPAAHMEVIKRDAHLWVNIEYLSAEKWIEDCHGKESPQVGIDVRKYFFMPGFTKKTGGIIPDFYAEPKDKNIISVFTYNNDFSSFFEACKNLPHTEFMIFDKYSQDMLKNVADSYPMHDFTMAPFLPPAEYDQILASSSLNLVRGEVSFVRAIFAGKPFIWHAYIQENDYQLVKVKAFLDVFEPFWEDKALFKLYSDIMMAWNGNGESISVDNWSVFLENRATIGTYTQSFGDFLRHECNLGVNFDNFIKGLW